MAQTVERLVPMTPDILEVVSGWYKKVGAKAPPAGDLFMVSHNGEQLSGFASVSQQPSGIYVNGLIGFPSACTYILALVEELAVASRRCIVLRVSNKSAERSALEQGFVLVAPLVWVKAPAEGELGARAESPVDEEPEDDEEVDPEDEEDLEDDEEPFDEDEEPFDELDPEEEPRPRVVQVQQRQTIPRKHASKRRGRKGTKRGRTKKR